MLDGLTAQAVQEQINAIESLSNVTVLCTDKTGALTANRIRYHARHPVGVETADLERLLADFAASASAVNKTSEAIIEALPGARRPLADEAPFSSARKWSALAFDDPGESQRSRLRGAGEQRRSRTPPPSIRKIFRVLLRRR